MGSTSRIKGPVLQAQKVRKAFPGVLALDDVDFEVSAGEVVALVGENGAGKSTLMKLLAGIFQPDGGQIVLDGKVVKLRSPLDALQQGVALIHQELSLCDNLTVSGAVFLGSELRSGPFLHEREMAEATRHWLDRLGLSVNPDAKVSELRLGQRQLLEIARALRADARVLIMDEPTSSLTQIEVERLYGVVRELRDAGVAIVYITHRLAEVEVVADRVVGLRDGRNSGQLARDEICHESMVQLMVGRDLIGTSRVSHKRGEESLAVRGLRTKAFPDASVDITLHCGEVVGIAGLLGSGRSELLRAMFGVDTSVRGTVSIMGAEVPRGNPRQAASRGMALLPEDRKSEGLVLEMSVGENLSLPTLHRRGLLLDRAYEHDVASAAIADLGIACRGENQPAGALSGGNQQKIVLGKWLAAKPKVLLLDEPTRGVDVGARAEIYRRLDQLAKEGLSILFVSSELEEVLQLADRVLVMRDGAIAGELVGLERTEDRVMMLATGSSPPLSPSPPDTTAP